MYNNANEKVKDGEVKQEPSVKLATVTALFDDGCPKIRFYGEDEASEKEYSYLSTYIPAVNDIVVLVKTDSSYIILGKINYKVAPDNKVDVETKLEEALEEYIPFYHDDNGNKILRLVSGAYSYFAALEILNAKIETLTADEINVDNPEDSYIRILKTKKFSIDNVAGYFGVFGATPRGRYNMSSLSTSAELSTVISKVNDIITALKSFGFFY